MTWTGIALVILTLSLLLMAAAKLPQPETELDRTIRELATESSQGEDLTAEEQLVEACDLSHSALGLVYDLMASCPAMDRSPGMIQAYQHLNLAWVALVDELRQPQAGEAYGAARHQLRSEPLVVIGDPRD